MSTPTGAESPKVFGVGFNKTGTSTLGKCFDILGLTPVARPQALHDSFQDRFGAYPYRAICDEVFDRRNHQLAIEIAAGFNSFHDRPWNIGDLYQDLDVAFPGSLFILTWREPAAWWRSTRNWLTVSHPDDDPKLGRYLRHLDTERVDEVSFVDAYLAHNEAVRAYFGDRPNFLEVNFERGDRWQRLCRFLGMPIPEHPFPHENRQTYLSQSR